MPQAFSRLRSLLALTGTVAACDFACTTPLAAQSLSPAAVSFTSVPVGSATNATLTFTAPSPTTIASINTLTDGVTAQDFNIIQQNCVGTVTTCTIQVGFTPSFAGKRNGFVGLLASNGNLVARAYLTGIGIYGQVSFTPSTISSAATVAPVTPANFSPTSAVPDGAGNIYLNDIANSRLLKFSNTGVFSSVTALTGSTRSALAIDGGGTIYASSPTQGVVYAVPPGGVAAPFSTASVALVTPTGVATQLGNLYIADAGNNRIVRVALDGSGSAVVTLPGITLSSPAGLVVDGAGNLYIVDSGNDRVILYSPSANTASVVPITGLTLNNPAGITVDAAGTLYIADTGNQRIAVVPSTGAAYALPLNNTTLATPTGVTVFTAANIMISDSTLGLVTVARSSLTVNFPTATKVGAIDSTDGYKTFGIQNTGNITLGYVTPTSGNNPAISNANFTDAGGTFTCPNVTPASGSSAQLAPGASCTYAAEFTPIANGADTATFTMHFADPNGSGVNVAPFATLTGTGTTSLAKFTITATPTSVLLGAPVSFTVTALNASGQTATDYLDTVTFSATDSTAVFLGGATYTFTAADAGTHTFSGTSAVDFHQLGSFTITVADGSTNATSNAVQVQTQSASALTATPTSIAVGGTVILTATIGSATAGITRVPTGTVTFSSVPTTGATAVTLGIATLTASGVATFPTTFSTGGDPCITATYSGDTAFTTSTSTSVCISVGDFSLTLDKSSSASATVVYGQPVSYLFDVTPVGTSTLFGPINFTVTGLGSAAPYTITPSTINAGASASTVRLTITPVAPAVKTTPIAIALLALPLVWWRRRKFTTVLAAAVLMALIVFPIGCSSSSGYFNPKFSLYTIVMTGTSGTTTHSVTVSLIGE